VAWLLVLSLLLQGVLTDLAFFAPAAVAATSASSAEPQLEQTGLVLPTLQDRLGGSDAAVAEPQYIAPSPDAEPGPLRPDGSFRLPHDYVPNPDNPGPVDATVAKPYAAHRQAGGKTKSGGVGMLMSVSGDITTNTTWTLANSPYVVTGTINVQSPAVLTIEPGVVVKFDTGANLLALAGATLTANGTSTAPIVFTSLKDDSVAGDTNGDGTATTPAAGDWNTLGITGYKDASGAHAAFGSLQFVTARYGQQVSVRFSMPTLADDTISAMSLAGLYLDTPAGTTYTIQRMWVSGSGYDLWLYAVPSTTTIQNSTFRGATGLYSVLAQTNTAAKLTSNAIEKNSSANLYYAISAGSSPMVLRYNSISNNRITNGTDMGLTASGSTVDAQYNWWGSTSGPAVTGQTNTGGGSTVSASYVTTTNWLGTAFSAEHKKGDFPWSLKAGVGADVATGNFVMTEHDLSLSTIGVPLDVTRTYNNQTADTVTSDMGFGWTWTYGTNINTAADTNGGLVWEQPDGAKNYFKKNADNTFTGEQGVFSILSYDPVGLTYTITHPDQTKWVFNSTGKLIAQVDTDGNTSTIARDGTGKITTITEPTGRQLTVTYTGSYITRITDPLGRTYDYVRSALNTITSLTKKTSTGTTFATCTYGYTGAASALTSFTDCDGNVLTQTYDTSKRVATQNYDGNAQVRFVYGPATDSSTGLVLAANSTGVWDSRGKAHIYFYTTNNKVTEHWREQNVISGSYTWYTEDKWDYVSYQSSNYRDINSNNTASVYDWTAGNLTKRTAPGNRITTYTYDAFNNRTSSTDNLSHQTQFQYDAEQHLTKIIDPLLNETTTTYTTAGLPATVTDARGKVTSFTYDAYGYPATVTNGENETVTFSYDAGGRKLWEETPQGKRTTYTYNGRDQVLTVTDPLLNVTTNVYDAAGRKTSVTDPEGRVTTFTYDTSKNALQKTTDAKNGTVQFTRDNYNANVTQVTDADGHATVFTYDVFNNMASEKDANLKIWNYAYLNGAKISQVTDALNAATTYTYVSGNMADLQKITYPDTKTITYTYDGVGNRATMVDWNGTTTTTYDALNRVTSVAGPSGTVSYTYDAVGNLASITYPGPKTVAYTYDGANRLKTVTDWDSRVTTYTYDTAGRTGTFTLPNGVVTTFGYDDANHVSHVDHALGGTTIAARDYTFDKLGNRKTAVSAAGTESYTYDELYRLAGVTYPDATQSSYTYDAAGNRLTQTVAGVPTSYTYDVADQLTNAGDGLRAYNANGDLTQIGAHRGFTWDARHQLTQITDAPANTAPTANAGANQSEYVNRLVILDGRASSDPEGEALSYSWTEDATNPATGILQGAHSPQPGFTPTVAGTYGFHLTVSDGQATSSAAAVTVTIAAGTPPTSILSSTALAASSGQLYTQSTGTGTFNTDMIAGANGTTVTYEAIAQFVLPTTPANTYASAASLDLTGKTTSGNVAGDAWSVRLLPPSVDANWTTQLATVIANATPASTLTPVLTGTGQVVANVANHWNFGAADLTVLQNRVTGTGKLSLRVDGNLASTASRVYWNGGNSLTTTYRPKLTVTYSPTVQYDHAPIARAGVDQTTTPGTLVTLHGEDSYDYEGGVSYAWTQNAANPATVTLSSATDASPTFTPTVPGTYRFSLVATDSASQQSTSDEVMVTVVRQLPPHATSYAYDGDGNRISQTNDGTVTSYVVDTLPANDRVLSATTGTATTYFIYGKDLLYSIDAAGPHFHHADSLGSTIAVTDSTGAVEQTYGYDIFGAIRNMTGTGGTKFTFTGEQNDDTGLMYLRARYYDPSVGRFLSRDPFPMQPSDTQTVNRYAYVKNDPTNYVDPSGEQAVGGLEYLLIPLGAYGAAALSPYLQKHFGNLIDTFRRAAAPRSNSNSESSSGPRMNGKPSGPNPSDPSKFIRYGTGPLLMRLGADHANLEGAGHYWSQLQMTAAEVENVVASTLNNASSLDYGLNPFTVAVNGYILEFNAFVFRNGMVSVGTWWVAAKQP
jgi:RHS repeat-associated protein